MTRPSEYESSQVKLSRVGVHAAFISRVCAGVTNLRHREQQKQRHVHALARGELRRWMRGTPLIRRELREELGVEVVPEIPGRLPSKKP